MCKDVLGAGSRRKDTVPLGFEYEVAFSDQRFDGRANLRDFKNLADINHSILSF